jgi:ubiquitin-protein ligase E3 A
MAHYMSKSIERQFKALKKGFLKVCGGRALGLCRSSDLELLICGLSSNAYRYEDLKKVTKYDDGYDEGHEEIQ